MNSIPLKNFFSVDEATTINNMNAEAQNTLLGSAVRTALMGGIGFKDGERLFVDSVNGNDGFSGEAIDQPMKTIQAAVNKARYVPGGTVIATNKDRRRYIFVMPGQYNEQVLFSGYNISLIGIGHRSNGDYGVVINYDDAVVATAVVAFSGSGLEIANICIQCSQAIPALLLSSVSDAVHIHDCWIKGDNAKTCTMGISAAIKNSVIEDNIINGCITGINVAAGAWFNNSIVRRNKITNVTNGIALAATCVPTESEISDNVVVGSATSIVNAQATDVVISRNEVYPDISDAGTKTGGNILLSAEVAGDIESKVDAIITYHAVPTADAVTNTRLRDVAGNKTDTYAGTSLVSLSKQIQQKIDNGRTVWYANSAIGVSGAGTRWDNAFATISEAVAAASAGDVIMIRGEFSSVTEGATIDLDKELWLIGENTTPNQGCTMIYNGGAAAYPLVTVSAHQCKIFNIYFSQIATQNSIEVGAFWKTHIKGCRFDEASIMINVPGDSPDTTIEDCLFRSWTTYAIDIYCTRAMIKNCRFLDVALASTAIRNTADGGNRPDTCILDCRFHTYDVANGVAIEVTNTPTAGMFYIDGCHFSYYADDNHAVSKRTGYCGINWRDAAVLPVT